MCMVDFADENATVLHERHPKARKEHRCSECGRAINAGESYMVERFVCDGAAQTHKTCEHCQVVRSWLIHECNGFVFGGVAEDVQEHVQEGDYGFGVKKLVIGIGRKWIRRDGRMWPVPTI